MYCLIGQRSNLSYSFFQKCPQSLLVNSEKIDVLLEILHEYQDIDIVFNSFNKTPNLEQNQSPVEYCRRTIGLTSQLAAICMKKPDAINSVIFSSSSAVYGNNKRAVETDPIHPHNLYSSTKIACELLLKQALAPQNVRLIIARLFNVYGNNDSFSVISKINRCLTDEKEFELVNDGQAIRDFIHVDDVVCIYQKLASTNAMGVFNVGTGVGTQVSDIIKACENKHSSKLKVRRVAKHDIQHCVSSNTKLNSIIGVQTFRKLESAL